MFIILHDGAEVFIDASVLGLSKRLDKEVLARLHSVLGEGLLVSLLEDGNGERLTEYREYVWVRGLDPRMIFFAIEDARKVLENLMETNVEPHSGSGHA